MFSNRKTLMIVGGSGFFANSILQYIKIKKIKKIKKIILIQRKKNFKDFKINNIQIKKIYCNILSIKKLPKADFVIYCVNIKNIEKDKNSLIHFMSMMTLKFAKTKFLYTSSGAVYGPFKSYKNTDENLGIIIKKNNFKKGYKKNYAITKRENERFLTEFAKKKSINISIARCFTFVGDFIPLKKYAVGNIIEDVLKNREIKIFSKIQVKRSYMHSNDLAKILLKILFRANVNCPIYNVGSSDAITIQDLAKKIGKIFKLRVKLNKFNTKKFDYYVPKIDKLKQDFNFKLTFSSIDAVIKVIRSIIKKNEKNY